MKTTIVDFFTWLQEQVEKLGGSVFGQYFGPILFCFAETFKNICRKFPLFLHPDVQLVDVKVS